MRKLSIVFLILISLGAANAETVISNSASWEDVYSGGIYAALKGLPHQFLISLSHGENLKKEVTDQNVLIIESDTVPYVKNYAARLKADGRNTQIIKTQHGKANLDLARRLQVDKYYIVDPSLGYDAISVAPIAVYEKAYVLFATKENINEIMEHFQNAPPKNIAIAGETDNEVTEALSQYNPEIIKKGSRYKNNVELAERLRRATNSDQAILTNGEFLVEDIFIAGQTNQPILYIGKHRPPEETMKYLQAAGLKVTVLIGNELLGSAKRIKDLLQIPIFVKFGKGMTEVGGVFTTVQGLDTMPVPTLDLLLTLQGIGYNTETGQVELYVKNEKPLRTYLLSSIAIKVDGQLIQTIGDDEPQLLAEYEQNGYMYPAALNPYIGRNLTAEILIPYGYTPDEMDEAIELELPLGIISEKDDCELEITDAAYEKETAGFIIEVETNGNCFTQAFMKNLKVNDELIMPQSTITQIDGKGTLRIKQSMTEIDIADNPEITVQVRYGSRAILTKIKEKTFKWKYYSDEPDMIALLKTPLGTAMTALIIILLILLLWKKKR